jgi:superfamily I DNA/RNA helicase
VFVVKKSDVDNYLAQYQPKVLRRSIPNSGFIKDSRIYKVNFGKTKGLGFDRVLILPTVQYLKKNNTVFKSDKTEEAKNKLYVAMTRARYSLAFLIDDADASKVGYPIWQS